jgi:hypothetical protein
VSTLVACLGVALSLMIGGFLRDLGVAASNDGRAQLAADAAALAAVAESGPFGELRPRQVADDYARRNGARIVECRCEPGATAMQVTVELEGVRASARAVLDPEMLAPMTLRIDRDSLHPVLQEAVARLLDGARGGVWITSGFRTRAEQAALWRRALARYGSPSAADDWVAPPGRSAHEQGVAVDLGGDLELAARLVSRLNLPLSRPLANEPWHFELSESRL